MGSPGNSGVSPAKRGLVVTVCLMLFIAACVVAGLALLRMRADDRQGRKERGQNEEEPEAERQKEHDSGKRRERRDKHEGENLDSPSNENSSTDSSDIPQTRERTRGGSTQNNQRGQPNRENIISKEHLTSEVRREIAEERARRSAARNRAISEVREEVRQAERKASETTFGETRTILGDNQPAETNR